jgi:hypothetical protein
MYYLSEEFVIAPRFMSKIYNIVRYTCLNMQVYMYICSVYIDVLYLDI